MKASNKDTFRAACKEFRDDYMECLHHNKEVLPHHNSEMLP